MVGRYSIGVGVQLRRCSPGRTGFLFPMVSEALRAFPKRNTRIVNVSGAMAVRTKSKETT